MNILDRSARSSFAVIEGARKVDAAAQLLRRRKAITSAEDEDAHLTGMTRSLDRRLLALNLYPGAGMGAGTALKVA